MIPLPRKGLQHTSFAKYPRGFKHRTQDYLSKVPDVILNKVYAWQLKERKAKTSGQ